MARYSISNKGSAVFRRDRLEALMAEKSLSQNEMAKRIGITQSSVWKLLNQPAQGSKHIHKIARELGTTPAYLMGETEDPSEGFVPAPSVNDVAKELGIVGVRELDLSLGMGATYLDTPVTETMRYFDEDWLRVYTRSKPENLVFAQGIGDSMEPTIRDSDLMLIDVSQRNLNISEKIWVVAYAHCASVKRLSPRADGGVDMLCDNHLVPNKTAYDGEMHIVGRVVAVVRKM